MLALAQGKAEAFACHPMCWLSCSRRVLLVSLRRVELWHRRFRHSWAMGIGRPIPAAWLVMMRATPGGLPRSHQLRCAGGAWGIDAGGSQEARRRTHYAVSGRVCTAALWANLCDIALRWFMFAEFFGTGIDFRALLTVQVYSVAGILIFPFWSMVMLIWSKLQLDRWRRACARVAPPHRFCPWLPIRAPL